MDRPHRWAETDAVGEIINLNRLRKARARDAEAAKAAENRVRHGRTGAEKARDATDAARRRAALEGHRVESSESSVPDSPPPKPRG